MAKSLLALTIAATGLSASAATTGSLTLQGTVAQVLSIGVTPTDGTPGDATYSGIDLHTTSAGLLVANASELSNSNTGYKVKVTYDGVMENAIDNSTPFSYSLLYNDSAVATGTDTVVTNNGSGVYNLAKTVKIAYTGVAQENLVAGTYSDTVQFTIEAN